MSGRAPPKPDYMSRRIPTNPRYRHVRAATDTGASMSKHVDKINEIKTNFKYRKDELFKRMKVATLVQLMIQVAEFNFDYNPENDDDDDNYSIADDEENDVDPTLAHRPAGLPSGVEHEQTQLQYNKQRYEQQVQQQRMQQQIHSQPREQQAAPSRKLALEIPYLLLDVRESTDYEKCHLRTSVHYPSTRLARVMNYETPDLLNYKNKEGRIIVLYDEEEKLAPRVAQTFVERGYENLFLLSGGMKVALHQFPVGLFTGVPPRHLVGGGAGGGAVNRVGSALSSARLSSGSTSTVDDDAASVSGASTSGVTAADAALELTLADLNALRMALESAAAPATPPKTGRIATAASVGREQRANIDARNTARKEKLVGGQWR